MDPGRPLPASTIPSKARILPSTANQPNASPIIYISTPREIPPATRIEPQPFRTFGAAPVPTTATAGVPPAPTAQTTPTQPQSAPGQKFYGEFKFDQHYHFGTDARNALDSVIKENDDLKAQVSRLNIQVDEHVRTIGHLRNLQTNPQPQQPPQVLYQNVIPAHHMQEMDSLRRELAAARQQLAAVQQELSAAQRDVDVFKIWTKKLDWSTTEGRPPPSLQRLFDIGQATGRSSRSDGTQGTTVVQTVDGVWHGPYVSTDDDGRVDEGNYCQDKTHGVVKVNDKGRWAGVETMVYWMGKNLNKEMRLLDDGSRMYICADEHDDGASVGVLDRPDQRGNGYVLKNGYSVALHNYKNEVQVNVYQNSKVVTTKWYQLKK